MFPFHIPSLTNQKKVIRQSLHDYLILTIFFGVMVPVCLLWETSPLGINWVPAIFFAVIALFCLVSTLKRFHIHRLMKSIQEDSDEKVTVHCVNFYVLTNRESRYESSILYVVFRSEDEQKYYCIAPKHVSTSAITDIRRAVLDKDLHLICYRGTHIVKFLADGQ